MDWGNKYSEDYDQEVSIDYSTNERLENQNDKIKKEVTELIDRGVKIRGKKFLDEPTQRKFIKEMLGKGFSAKKIGDTLRDLNYSEFWQKQDRLPDFKTVFNCFKNKK